MAPKFPFGLDVVVEETGAPVEVLVTVEVTAKSWVV